MDYSLIYNNLINTRKMLNRRKNKIEYFENHHIIPKCIGGSDDKENLVLLTAREHYIAHYLLTRIYNINSLYFSFNMMHVKSTSQERNYINSRLYEANKIKLSKILSEQSSILFSGENNPMYGKNHTDETKQKLVEWHANMSEEEKVSRSLNVSIGTKEAMNNLSELKIYNMRINQQFGSYGFHFIMVKDNDNNFSIFKNMKKDFKDYLKNNFYNSKFYNWEFGIPYERFEFYTNRVPKTVIEKDINTIGLIKYKMERIKI